MNNLNPRQLVALSAPLVCVATSVTANSEVVISQAASEQFAKGVTELTSSKPGHFLRAHRAFQSAYEQSPAWQILGNLGIAADALERNGEAMAAYKRYLSEGAEQIDASEAAQFRTDLARLQVGSIELTITISNGPVYLVDTRQLPSGDSVVNRYGPYDTDTSLLIRAGKHTLHAERRGFGSTIWQGNFFPGASATHHFAMSSLSESLPATTQLVGAERNRQFMGFAEESHTGAYWSWTMAGIGAAAGLGLLGNALRLEAKADTRFERLCIGPNRATQTEVNCFEDMPEDLAATPFNIAAAVSAGVSTAFLLTGSILYWGLDDEPPTVEKTPLSPKSVKPPPSTFRAWLHPTGIGLSGTF